MDIFYEKMYQVLILFFVIVSVNFTDNEPIQLVYRGISNDIDENVLVISGVQSSEGCTSKQWSFKEVIKNAMIFIFSYSFTTSSIIAIANYWNALVQSFKFQWLIKISVNRSKYRISNIHEMIILKVSVGGATEEQIL